MHSPIRNNMYSRLARNALLAAGQVTPNRGLVVVTTLNSRGLRSISIRPARSASRLCDDSSAPLEPKAVSVPRTQPLDYFAEVMIDFNNFRDLLDRFERAHRNGDKMLMKFVSNTLIYEVSMYCAAKELVVYKALERHGFEELVQKSHLRLTQFRDAFIEAESYDTNLDIEGFAESIRTACRGLLEYVENEEKEQYISLFMALTAQERAQLASEYLEARLNAPKRLRPADAAFQHPMDVIVKPTD
ncbi:hemerythrin-like protein [Ceratobasidium sp. AG-Ba]|nr:hemerythrin-like protein [Ceratobasidium sp. AG-Ba]